MSMRYPGGLIAASPVNAQYPSGVWTQAQTIPYAAQNVWQRDQYWRNTTLLLHGDGTNGAQNNTFLDSSTNNFTITRNGNTTQGAFTPYQQNGYWSNFFGGSGNSLSLADSAAWDFGSGDFTIECWANTAVWASQYNVLVCQWNTSNAWIFRITPTLIGLYADIGGTQNYTATVTNTLNTWDHYAVTRSGTTLTFWKNGVSVGTSTISGTINNSTNAVTVAVLGDLNANTVHNGYISNLRIVKGTAVYTSAFTPSAIPLTAISGTSLLTCQSNRFIDNSSNAFAITVTGTPSVQAFQPFPGATTWSASVLGGSGYFDGTGDYLTTPSNSALAVGSGDFTIEAWVYVTGGTFNSIFDTRANITTDANGYVFSVSSANGAYLFNNVASVIAQTGSGTVLNNSWNHVCFSRSGTTLRGFVNGALLVTVTNSTNFSSLGATTPVIGYNFERSGDPFVGYISNLRIVKGTAVYTSAFTPPTSPLTAITNTSLLLSMTNAGIYDNAQMNDLETAGNAQISTSVVKYGTGSMYFDGNGDYLQTYNTRLLTFNGSSTFTVEGWFFQTAYVSTSGYMNNVIGDLTPTVATALYWSIGMNASNQPGVRWYDGAVKTADASAALTLNQWNHVAWVVTAGVVKIFVNGVQATLTGTTTLTTPSTTVGYLIIGADRGYYMTGYMDDLRVSQGVARYTTTFTPPIARMPNQ